MPGAAYDFYARQEGGWDAGTGFSTPSNREGGERSHPSLRGDDCLWATDCEDTGVHTGGM